MAFCIETGSNAKIIGFTIGKMKIEDECLIGYRSDGDSGEYIESIKSTGRKKNIEPLSGRLIELK